MHRMFKSRKNDAGLTLVEMIVVVAIIGVMGAIAVPAVLKYRAAGAGEVQRAALDLQGMLRAAQIYASTNNIETAVAYVIDRQVDSLEPDSDPVGVLTAMGVVRKLTQDELNAVRLLDADGQFLASGDASIGLPNSQEVYYPVQDERGRFRPFLGDASIAVLREMGVDGNGEIRYAVRNIDGADVAGLDEENLYGSRALGLMPIRIVDFTEQVVGGLDAIDAYTVSPNEPYDLNSDGFASDLDRMTFPAHVFSNSGKMLNASPQERFRLNIMRAPSAPADTRWLVQPGEGGVAGGVPDAEYLDLFATMGRVKLAQR